MSKEILKVLLCGFLLAVAAGVTVVWSSSGSSIIDIGKHSIYVKGAGCTVNTGKERSVKDLRRDFEYCVRYHKIWLEEQNAHAKDNQSSSD
jgi:hypothetical protein